MYKKSLTPQVLPKILREEYPMKELLRSIGIKELLRSIGYKTATKRSKHDNDKGISLATLFCLNEE